MTQALGLILLTILYNINDPVKAFFDPSPIVPMSEYSESYRVLDCFQCFEAQGKFCHHRDYGQTLHDTQEANRGYAFCCRQDSTEGFCSPNSDYECSMPSYELEPEQSKYKDVLTKTNLNYQMFAFCPMISQRICGIANDDNTNVTLEVTD